MIRRLVETAGVIVVMVAFVLGVTSLSPAALPRTTQVTPPQDNKLVCLPAEGIGVLFATDAETVGELGEPGTAAADTVLLADQTEPVVLTGSKLPVGGYLNAIGPTKSWTACQPARSEGIVLVPGAANTELLIVNSDRSDAAVDLTLRGTGGEIEALGSRGIALSANSSREVALSVLTDETGPISVEFRSTRGRVTVIARTQTPAGLESATASVPDVEHLLPGVPAGAEGATVLLANPGAERVQVDVSALGSTADYTPLGGSDISLAAGSTLAVQLGASLAGEATALRVRADGPVGASLVTGPLELPLTGELVSEQAHVAPVEQSTEMKAHVQSRGVLQLSALEQVTARVTISYGDVSSSADVVVPAGGTTTVQLAQEAPGGQVISVTATSDVFGAVVHADGSGVAVVPLQPSGLRVPKPLIAELDPTLN